MKKVIKVILLISVIFIIAILSDTIQAKIFNNRPIIKISEKYNGGNVDIKDKGIFVYTYNFNDGEKVTVFKWEKYAPPLEEKEDIDLQNEDYAESESIESNMNYNVSVVINGNKYNAILEESKTAQSFASMLPHEYNMSELNGNEKYIYLDETFPTDSYNPKHIEKGDIMLYGNNCLVVFYKSFDTSYSYTKIGHIENFPDLDDKDITIKFEK